MGHLRQVMKYGKKAISTFLVANAIYFGSLIGTGVVANKTSPRINTQTQLEQLVERERRKIDPQNNYQIRAELFSKNAAVCRKLDTRNYKIEIGGVFANETTLRHELYHILDGHCDKLQKRIKYLFWYEPQAMIYQITGLKP